MINLLVRSFCFFSKSRSLADIYIQNVTQTGKFKDKRQLQILSSFQRLNDEIIKTHEQWKKQVQKPVYVQSIKVEQQQQEQRKGLFFFLNYPNIKQKKIVTSARQYVNDGNLIKGIYLYGSSGCGKTFISEIFYNNLNIKQKSKIHFHQFMANVQKDLFQLQQQKLAFDPLTTIANRRAKEVRLLFLDQFQVTDVADASILKRLFQKLIANKMILVATSNRKPDQLYKNGHQREHFVPFITFLKEKCQIIDALSSKDYRYDMEVEQQDTLKSYFSPIDDISEEKLNNIFTRLAKIPKFQYQQKQIEVIAGRSITVPRTKNGVCIYYFDQLCDNVMGDSDFRAISKHHKAIIIKNIPKISTHTRNIANRFIKLLDQVYVNNVKLYCNAEVGIQQIIKTTKIQEAVTQQQFAINRCKSRLAEFQAKKYKQKLSFYQVNQTTV